MSKAKKKNQNSARKRQMKALKARRKQLAKKKHAARWGAFSSHGVMASVRGARRLPIFECLINEDWREEGLAHIIVARKASENMMSFGVYLVDIYCMGVKNAFCNVNQGLTRYAALKQRLHRGHALVPCPAELAHQIVYGALDYAAGLGFRPHKDFAQSQWFLEPRENVPPNDTLEFGRNGKPFYVSGPDDNVARILAHLERKVGTGNYDLLVEADAPDAYGGRAITRRLP